MEGLKKKGIEVFFLNRPISDILEDQLLLGVQGLIAEYEKAKILERTRRGRIHKAKEKGIVGSVPPYGYNYVKKSREREGYYEINEDEARVVRLIFDLYLKFQSLHRVKKELYKMGIRTRKGSLVWADSTIHRVLTNEAYTGTGYYNRRQSVEVDDGRIVAVKIPRLDERAGKAFINEVSTWMQLDHKNIVKLYDANVVPLPYLELEFVEGAEVNGKLCRSLEDLPKPVDRKTALKIVKGIARGLSYAHSRGILHRDLKPGNILLTSDLEPKITDWGLAKIRATSSLFSGFTPSYAAPEQLSKAYGSIDQRTDIFQLGIIFYELLTGKNPFEGQSLEEIAGKITDEEFEIPMPSDFSGSLRRFDRIIARMLSRRKEGRFSSVDELLAELEKLSGDVETMIES